jgi:hypothetical protein
MSNLSKSKVVPLPLCRRKRGKHANILLILTSALEGVNGQRHAPAALYPQERTSLAPHTHWIGGWVELRAGLDPEAR